VKVKDAPLQARTKWPAVDQLVVKESIPIEAVDHIGPCALPLRVLEWMANTTPWVESSW
jgi:hypothetical protein